MIFTHIEIRELITNDNKEMIELLQELEIKLDIRNIKENIDEESVRIEEMIDEEFMKLIKSNNIFTGLKKILKKIDIESKMSLDRMINAIFENSEKIRKEYKRGEVK